MTVLFHVKMGPNVDMFVLREPTGFYGFKDNSTEFFCFAFNFYSFCSLITNSN